MIPILSPEIWHRDDFALLCNWRKLFRVVEVGVDRAEFAQCFMSRFLGERYLGVDPYEPYHEMPWDRTADFNVACMRFERYARFAKLVRDTSANVASVLQTVDVGGAYNQHYDFVYIDAGHKYDQVIDDMRAWWPIVSEFGIMAGHDFREERGDHSEVYSAVMDFAHARSLTVYFTPDNPQSWYIYKNGMPGPEWRRA